MCLLIAAMLLFTNYVILSAAQVTWAINEHSYYAKLFVTLYVLVSKPQDKMITRYAFITLMLPLTNGK